MISMLKRLVNIACFRFKTVLSCALGQKPLTIVLMAALAVGMFLPLVLIGGINSVYANKHLLRQLDFKDGFVVETLMPLEQENTIITKLKNNFGGLKSAGVSAFTFKIPAIYKEKALLVNVEGFDDRVIRSNRRLVSGRLPTKQEIDEGSPVALIVQDSTSLPGEGLRIGSRLVIQDTEFLIIGTALRGEASGDLMVPHESLKSIARTQKLQYKIHMVFDKPYEQNVVKEKFLLGFPGADIISVMPAASWISQSDDGFQNSAVYLLKQGGAALLFALMSIVLISTGRTLQLRYVYAVRQVAGASKAQIIMECWLEVLILVFPPLIIDLIAIYMLKSWISVLVPVLTNLPFIMFSFVFCVMLSLFVGVIGGVAVTRETIDCSLKGKT